MMDTSDVDTSRSLNVRPFRGRSMVDFVKVHRKISSPECWSITAVYGPDAGKVIAHADSIALYNARFVVSENGRQRVLRERRKNVHAWIIGELAPDHDWIANPTGLDALIWYNPYQVPQFSVFFCDAPAGTYQHAPVTSASHVHMGTDGKVRACGVRPGPGTTLR
jgi:hypothetical protein